MPFRRSTPTTRTLEMADSVQAAARFERVTRAASDAPWITMVHGVSQDRRVFSAQVAAFGRDYRLLLIDLPGHGLSSAMTGPYGVAEFAASIEAAMEEAGVARSHFWGTHIGAAAGLLLACRKPGLFQSLVLEAPVFPGRPLPAVSKMLARIARTAREAGMAAARQQWWEEGGWFAVMRAHPEDCRAPEQRAIIEDFAGAPWLDAGLTTRPLPPIDDSLRRLEIPVLIMNGENDLPDFVDVADELEALLPDRRRGVIEGAGGFPLWEFPEAVNAAVRSFLKGDKGS